MNDIRHKYDFFSLQNTKLVIVWGSSSRVFLVIMILLMIHQPIAFFFMSNFEAMSIRRLSSLIDMQDSYNVWAPVADEPHPMKPAISTNGQFS